MPNLKVVLIAATLMICLCMSSFADNKVVSISGGELHSVVLKSDGTLWACGNNYYGQLGDGTNIDRTTPVRVTGISSVISVDAASAHTLALRSDGTVWAWGTNFWGQIGDEVWSRVWSPVQIKQLSGIIAIAAGGYNSMALKSDGTVWAWGYNYHGQLGNGGTAESRVPVRVSELSDVVAIAANQTGGYAVKSDGTVWSWGNNTNGSLPTQVQGLSSIVSVKAASTYALALKSDGTLWAWGVNYSGRLGNGTYWDESAPAQVLGLSSVRSFSPGDEHALACKTDGSVWTWGNNRYGQLGNTSPSSTTIPCQVPEMSDVSAVDAGYDHSLILKSDGTVRGWGYNEYTQLGNGILVNRTTPIQAATLPGATGIDCGTLHTVAVTTDGTVWTWGANYSRQLGDGTALPSAVPINVPQLSGVTAVAAGQGHTAALRTDGTVWSWGSGDNLGNGTFTTTHIPTQATGLTDVKLISAGVDHTAALKKDGTLWVWGSTAFGGLGIGSSNTSFVPVQVTGVSDVTDVACGDYHTVAVKSDGTVWAWGYNNTHQCGDGTTIDRYTPGQVAGLSDIVKVAAGTFLNVALKADGSLWTWGHGNIAPVRVTTLNGVVDVSIGPLLTVAVKSDGTVWFWDSNINGQIGTSTASGQSAPIMVTGLSNIVSVNCGQSYTTALKSDGTVWAWGKNDCGQLGNGIMGMTFAPVPMGIPSGSFVINNNDPYTRSRSVTLFFAPKPTVHRIFEVQISNDGVFDTEPWETIVQDRQWTLTDGIGQKTVWVRFKDIVGLVSEAATDSILYDTTLPPGTLSGSVTDSDTGITIAGASVYFYKTQDHSGNPEYTATTDVQGRYSQAVSPGTWYVGAAKAEYENSPFQTVTVTSGGSITANFSLSLTPLTAIYKFDEATGTTANDSSGRGKTGTLANGPTWTIGKVGNCLSFDGIDDYVSIPDQRVCSSITIAAWIRLDSLAADTMIFACDGRDNGDVQLLIPKSGGRVRFSIIGDTIADTESTYAFTAADFGKWRHVAVVYDGTTDMVKFYINGRLDNEMLTVSRNASLTGGMRIGGWSGGSYFNGKIDEFGVYGRALSAREIADMVRLSSSDKISNAKKLANGEFVTLIGKVVTYAPRNASNTRATYCFYVEEMDRSAGLLVQTLSASRDTLEVGTTATLTGIMKTVSYTGQRYLEVSASPEPGTPSVVQPIGMTTKSIQRDSSAVGLLVRVIGKVVELSPDKDWCTMTDGYGVPTIVICETGIPMDGFAVGDTVVVTGAVGRDIIFGDAPESVVYPRSVVKL